MTRFKVIFRDRSIEIRQAARVEEQGGRVRLVDDAGEEVASWDAGEIRSIQEVDERDDRSEPRWSR
ncbi:MAG: hypothetical protein ACOC83_05265 [Gemmatimonadota bacterium]